MKYKTINELEHFDFKEAYIGQIQDVTGKLYDGTGQCYHSSGKQLQPGYPQDAYQWAGLSYCRADHPVICGGGI